MNLAHVADIEKPGLPAHRQMLIDDALIFNGHLPAEKLDHPSAQFLMAGKNACSFHEKTLESRKYFTTTESGFMQEK
jgi:hypothetical protein